MYGHRLFIRYASSTARSHKYLLSQSHFRVQCMQMCRHGQDDLLEFKQNEGFSPSPMFTETALKKIKHPVSSCFLDQNDFLTSEFRRECPDCCRRASLNGQDVEAGSRWSAAALGAPPVREAEAAILTGSAKPDSRRL